MTSPMTSRTTRKAPAVELLPFLVRRRATMGRLRQMSRYVRADQPTLSPVVWRRAGPETGCAGNKSGRRLVGGIWASKGRASQSRECHTMRIRLGSITTLLAAGAAAAGVAAAPIAVAAPASAQPAGIAPAPMDHGWGCDCGGWGWGGGGDDNRGWGGGWWWPHPGWGWGGGGDWQGGNWRGGDD
jgi:hypothetical protein